METKESIAVLIAEELRAVHGRSARDVAAGGGQPLTPRQQDTLDAIIDYIAAHATPPTVQELADIMGTSKVSAFERVAALEEKGWIRRKRFHARSIEVLDGRTRQSHERLRALVRQYEATE
jgi:SOS-response transcriptional repressor LexA